MFKEEYKHMSDQVHPSDKLINQVIEAAHSNENKKSMKIILFRKPMIAIISLCICMSLAIPVLAATVEPIYQLMYLVSPSIAQFFIPVQKTDEDNGIKMEVVSAYIHDNIAEIYITMKDLTENRIDSTTDLFDSYSINRSFDSAASCQNVGYDENTKTATFLITINEYGNKQIEGNKITFSVKEFLSHKHHYKDIDIPINLSSITTANNTQKESSNGDGGKDSMKYLNEENVTALVPSKVIDKFPVSGFELSGIGYIDGMLHIQTAVYDSLTNDNHGYLYLKNSSGDTIDCNYNFNFVNNYEKSNRIDYCEYVFDIPQEEIGQYSLYGDFVTSGMHTEGNWRVTFPLEAVKK
jgi:hypothetical protein